MIQNLENEIWMQHPIYSNYAGSNLGRIKSLERDVVCENGVTRHYKEHLIKPRPNKDGYLQFCIWENGKRVDTPYTHRFVWECFNQELIPSDRKNFQINHIDEDKTNNRIENLELVTAKENCNWGTHNERKAETQRNDPKRCKQVGQYKLNGELVKIWHSTRECGRNEFDRSCVSKCCKNKYSREGNNIYKNFIWKYIENNDEENE